jgi:hypothetical protein
MHEAGWLKDGLARSGPEPHVQQLLGLLAGARRRVLLAGDALIDRLHRHDAEACGDIKDGLDAAVQRLDAAEQLLQAPPVPAPRAAPQGKAEAAAAAAAPPGWRVAEALDGITQQLLRGVQPDAPGGVAGQAVAQVGPGRRAPLCSAQPRCSDNGNSATPAAQALKQLQQLRSDVLDSGSGVLTAQQQPLTSIHIIAEPSAGSGASDEEGGEDASTAAQLRARNEELEQQLQQLRRLASSLQRSAAAPEQRRQQGGDDEQQQQQQQQQQQARLQALVVARGSQGSSAALFHSPRAEPFSDEPPSSPGLARQGSGASSATWATAPTQGPASARSQHLGPAPAGSPRERRGAARVQPGRLAPGAGADAGGSEGEGQGEEEEDAPVASPRAHTSEQLPSRLRHQVPVSGSAMAEADQGPPLAALQRRGAAAAEAGGAQAHTAGAMQRLFSAGVRQQEQEQEQALESTRAPRALAAAPVVATSPTPSAELERLFAASFGRRGLGSSQGASQVASPSNSASTGSPAAAAAAAASLSLAGLHGALQQLGQQLHQGSPSLLQALGADLGGSSAAELQQRLASAQRCSSSSASICQALERECGSIRAALAARWQAREDEEHAAAAALLPLGSSEGRVGLPSPDGLQSPLQVRRPVSATHPPTHVRCAGLPSDGPRRRIACCTDADLACSRCPSRRPPQAATAPFRRPRLEPARRLRAPQQQQQQQQEGRAAWRRRRCACA